MIKSYKLLWTLLFFSLNALAADIPRLQRLFHENFDNFYQPRLCGQNIATLVKEAKKRNLNLDHAYVAKIVGAGFLETSGFYARNEINQRVMLGYFHYVLVADGYVFDFDLDEPLVLKLEDYVRLQFTPPYEPFPVMGMKFEALRELPYWTVTAYHPTDYLQSRPNAIWTKKLGELINLKKVLESKRFR